MAMINKDSTSMFGLGYRFGKILEDNDYIRVSTQQERDEFGEMKSEMLYQLLPPYDEIFDLRARTTSIAPVKLPMLMPPIDHKFDSEGNQIKFGGYLGNDKQYSEGLFIDKPGYKFPTKIKEPYIAQDGVNGLSKVGFRINHDIFNYLCKYGIEKGLLISHEDKDLVALFQKKISKSKKILNDVKSKFSKYNLEVNIMSLANCFKDEVFYIPMRMDQRTRIYTVTDNLDYQGSALARSLFIFDKPGEIRRSDETAIQYFKSFGAICYGNGVDKKSLKLRSKWVDDNEENILNFRTNNILAEAEEKYAFLAFCFEYEKFKRFLIEDNQNVFSSHFPIQLDASCNGYQHLALLTKDPFSLKQLNLTKAGADDTPKDLYYFFILEIQKFYTNLLDKNSELHKKYVFKNITEKTKDKCLPYKSVKKLGTISFKRSIVKKAVMTFVYNASSRSQAKYIKDQLILMDSPTPEYLVKLRKWFYQDGDKSIELDSEDIYTWLKCFHLVLAETLPKISQVAHYMKCIAAIFNYLELNIP